MSGHKNNTLSGVPTTEVPANCQHRRLVSNRISAAWEGVLHFPVELLNLTILDVVRSVEPLVEPAPRMHDSLNEVGVIDATIHGRDCPRAIFGGRHFGVVPHPVVEYRQPEFRQINTAATRVCHQSRLDDIMRPAQLNPETFCQHGLLVHSEQSYSYRSELLYELLTFVAHYFSLRVVVHRMVKLLIFYHNNVNKARSVYV